MRYMDVGDIKWVVAAAASELWAKSLFPELPVDEAMDALWEKIFAACRISDELDAVTAWEEHDAKLKAYENWLNEQNFDYLHYEAPGTDFKVGLAEQHRWIGGSSLTPDGVRYMANMPTEEIFSTPHAKRAEGKLKSSMPLAISGKSSKTSVLNSRTVKWLTYAGKNGDVLETQLNMDEAARRLGEVALVPNSSLFADGHNIQSTLDENAPATLLWESLRRSNHRRREDDVGRRAELGFNSL